MVVCNIKLNNGILMPEIGLGTGKTYKTGVLAENVKSAIEMGYRHIDCAESHESQCEIGKAIKKANVPRKQLFITTKISKNGNQPELVFSAVKEILNNLQLDYIDLLLINWLYADSSILKSGGYALKGFENVPIMDTWKAMEALVVSGKVRAIGVSNFSRVILEMMIPRCRIVPAVNQIEVHPHNPEHELVNYCQSNGITVIGHSPLGGDCVRVMDDKLIKDIAKSHSCTPAQVIISWLWVRGIAVIPRSNNESRLKENLCTVPLTLDEMQIIGKIEKRERRFDSKYSIDELAQIFYGHKTKLPSV